MLALAPGVARAQNVRADTEQSFDLPAQPLGHALAKFAKQTHLNLFFEPATIDSRRSAPLRGRFTARVALQRLLANTGLTSLFTGPRYAIVYPVGRTAPEAPVAIAGSAGVTLTLDLAEVRAAAPVRIGQPDRTGVHSAYAERVMAEIRPLIEQEGSSRRKAQRLLIGVATDGAGHIREVRVGRGSGDDAADQALATVLVGHKLAEPPPAGLVQPMWFAVRVGSAYDVRQAGQQP